MSKKTVILGIESSCDETAAAIIQANSTGVPKILSNIISSQIDIHKEFGGVVPELAARSHVEKIDLITKKALEKSGLKINDIDAVAATAGPGLIVCLAVGLNFGKAIAKSLNKPFIAVNHLEGHALSPKLDSSLEYPYLLLLISGGHTQYLSVEGLGKYKRLGTTIDDALGEAYDKTAKLLGIEFPGGCNLSFAGLKTSILRISKQIKNDNEKFDLAASFQKTIEEILYIKTKIAFDQYLKLNKNKTFVIAGGVAANIGIRNKLIKVSNENNFKTIFPNINLCSDNAAMIAMVGLEKYNLKQFNKLDFKANPRWALDEKAKFLKGSGVNIGETIR